MVSTEDLWDLVSALVTSTTRNVRAVTEHANADPTGRAWQSLADVLPLLAEAAPDVFLDAGLAGDPPVLRSLFMDAELGMTFGTSSHIRLVWALEAVAWSSAHMSRAAGALARLAEIDPHPASNSHPRPAGSLAGLFNLNHPQTSLPLARRLRVLDGLRLRAPAAAWGLLRAILPTRLAVQSPSHRPRWRPGVSQIVARVIEDAGKDPSRWRDLVSHIDTLAPDDRDRLLAAFEMLDRDASTTSASAGPTPEPTSSCSSRTSTSASSTPPPANYSASSPSTPAATTSPPAARPEYRPEHHSNGKTPDPNVGSRSFLCPERSQGSVGRI